MSTLDYMESNKTNQPLFGITKITGSLRSKRMTSIEERSTNETESGRHFTPGEELEPEEPVRKRIYDFRGSYPIFRKSSSES